MKRLYVLVNKNLPCSLPAVQAGHVVAEFCLRSPQAMEWNNEYLIYLEVYSFMELENWEFNFFKRDIPVTRFFEPDMGNDMTAICALIADEDVGFLGKLNLLT
jgi:hypothetical protein